MFVQEAFSRECPIVVFSGKRMHVGLTASDRFLLRTSFKPHELTLATPLHDRERHQQVRSVGNAPRSVRECKTCKQQC